MPVLGFCEAKVVAFAGADFQPWLLGFCTSPLGVAFLELDLDLMVYRAGVVDLRDFAGDALREESRACDRWRP